MKVAFAVILAVASASAIGSGPYLPSGWKPDGPAFYLPSEIKNPSENPLKDTILQESVGSGSDFLREYGPPNVQEVSQDLTKQYLPEVVTEQAFVVIETKLDQKEEGKEISTEIVTKAEEKEENVVISFEEVITDKVVDGVTEANEDLKSTITEEVSFNITTEVYNEQPSIIGKSLNIELPVEETATIVQEVNEITQKIVAGDETENSNSDFVSSIQESVEVEGQNVAEVNNIAESLVNLEKEINAQQVQGVQEVIEVKTVDSAGSLQDVPEGFLEYGPPGFREYGPPKENELPSETVEETSSNNLSDNETRKRRFSPKFRSAERIR